MRYWDALQLVLDEAESSAMTFSEFGESNQEVLEATALIQEWLRGLNESSDLLDFLLLEQEE